MKNRKRLTIVEFLDAVCLFVVVAAVAGALYAASHLIAEFW